MFQFFMTFRYPAKVLLALSVVRNVAWFDSKLTMTKHVNKLCSAEYFILITVAIQCMSLILVGLAVALVCRTVCLLSSLVKFRVYKTRRRVKHSDCQNCAISLRHLLNLRCFPVRYRIDFNSRLLTFKAINGSAPSYLRQLVAPFKIFK